jgi:hypothetical protein
MVIISSNEVFCILLLYILQLSQFYEWFSLSHWTNVFMSLLSLCINFYSVVKHYLIVL